MAINRPAVNVALADGTDHENVRLNIQDQLQWSKTARARKWPADDGIMMTHFMAWHALKRHGLTEMGWEEFSTGGAEWIAEVDEDTAATLEDPADPTR